MLIANAMEGPTLKLRDKDTESNAVIHQACTEFCSRCKTKRQNFNYIGLEKMLSVCLAQSLVVKKFYFLFLTLCLLYVTCKF